jgi:superfamily II DNA/RNA helicase
MLQVINKLNSTGKRPHFFGGSVAEISSSLSSSARERVMREAGEGTVKILVATDQMARGIDLPNATLVINYDPPKFAQSYVHRAGRTARAGRNGHCLTILKYGQVSTFKKVRAEISSSNILRKVKLDKGNAGGGSGESSGDSSTSGIYALYKQCLSLLGSILSREAEVGSELQIGTSEEELAKVLDLN